jgi:hypothetical protein
MINVKLTTCAPNWPWARQTPEQRLEWGPFRFHVDTDVAHCDAWVVFESLSRTEHTHCPPENVFFIAGEPDAIGAYQPAFLDQFEHVVSGRNDLLHRHQIRLQQGHPWFVEKSFDELTIMPPLHKTREISVISSDKAFTKGHRARLEFVRALQRRFGDRVDVWGRGLRDFDQKWDVLAPYRYAIVLENFAGDDFLTEKLPDALLAYCFPIYYGCTNVDRYLADDATLRIDIDNPEASLEAVAALIETPGEYERRLDGIARARQYYLHQLQFFANLAGVLQDHFQADLATPPVSLAPNCSFPKAPPPAPPKPTAAIAPSLMSRLWRSWGRSSPTLDSY